MTRLVRQHTTGGHCRHHYDAKNCAEAARAESPRGAGHRTSSDTEPLDKHNDTTDPADPTAAGIDTYLAHMNMS